MDHMLNRATLIGEVADEVKIHYIKANAPIARFHLITTETFYSSNKNKDFIHRERHDIFLKDELAERCQRELKKGAKVYLEGSIRNKKSNNQGHISYFVEIHAHCLILLKEPSETFGVLSKEKETPDT